MSRDTKKTVPLPYQEWWQTIGHRRRRGREVVFQMGRAPINLPPHPARLELLRMVAPLEEDLSTATTEQLLNTAPGGFFGKSNGRHVQKAGMPRSFSGECCQVIHEQAPIESFDVQEVYRGCTLFQSCSPGFIQKLMATGGTTARQGKIFECGSCIYQEGQRGSSMFVIVRGTVALVSGANKQVVGAGDCIGVAQGLGVLAERQETALAETSVQVLEVTLSALTTIFTEKEEFYSPSCFGGHSSGNLYNRERRHFELEIRRLGALRSDGGSGVRGLRSGRGPSKARRKNEDGPGRAMQPTKSLKRGTLSPRKVACAEEAEERIQGHISCLQHPRLWRQQVQQLQRELIDGDFNEGRALREAFLQSLSSSITQDFNNGYQQPLDSPIRANMDERPHGALTGASAHGAASAHGTASAGVEEEVEEVTTGMLELSLLPCFPDMSCKQKVDLFHHMNAQNKAHAARSRLSGPHSARLSSRGHEE